MKDNGLEKKRWGIIGDHRSASSNRQTISSTLSMQSMNVKQNTAKTKKTTSLQPNQMKTLSFI